MERAPPPAVRLLLEHVSNLHDDGALDGRHRAVDICFVIVELETSYHVLEKHGELAVVRVRVQPVRRSAGQRRDWHAQKVVPGRVGAQVAGLKHLADVVEVLHAENLAYEAHVLERLLGAGREPSLEEVVEARKVVLNQLEIRSAWRVRPARVSDLHGLFELRWGLLAQSFNLLGIQGLGGDGVTDARPALPVLGCVGWNVDRVLDC